MRKFDIGELLNWTFEKGKSEAFNESLIDNNYSKTIQGYVEQCEGMRREIAELKEEIKRLNGVRISGGKIL